MLTDDNTKQAAQTPYFPTSWISERTQHWQLMSPCAHESNRHKPELDIVRQCPASKKKPAGKNCFFSISLAQALLETIGATSMGRWSRQPVSCSCHGWWDPQATSCGVFLLHCLTFAGSCKRTTVRRAELEGSQLGGAMKGGDTKDPLFCCVRLPYIHTYIHPYIHTCIYVYLYTHTRTCLSSIFVC